MFYQKVKKEPDDELESRIEIEAVAGEWTLKTEEVNVSDLEFANDSGESTSNLPDPPSASYERKLFDVVKTEQKCYECSSCMSEFSKKRSLRRHITKVCFGAPSDRFKSTQTNHTTTSKTPCWKKMFECQLCKKKFDVRIALKQHLRNHPTSSSHKCKICDKKFTRVSHRNRHMLSHTGQRNFACEVCGRTYTRKLNRDKHRETTHKVAKPEVIENEKDSRNFECSVCHKAYKTNAQRNKHLTVHSNVRKFLCGICEKAFVKKDHLNVHMKLHNRVESFECYVCNKTFLHGSARNRHMLIHMEN